MRIPVGRKYFIDILAPRGFGSGKIVRVYQKLFLFRRRISSDWFLDDGQAERFVRKVAAELAEAEQVPRLKSPIPE
jgi:hypothetical protein